MQYIGKSKIGKLSAKKGKIYAQIRLPSQLAYTIGEIADIFETERNGKRAFLLVTKQSVLDNDIVLQPKQKVVKPDDETEYNRRFKALESEINKLKSLLLLNQHQILHENQKGDEPEWARPDRTGDLRHVKAGNSAFLVAFSNFFALFSFTFGTFLPRDYHLSDRRTLVHAIHPQIDTGDKKQAIYNLFAAYIRTIPLEE
jgi:hypothetical protein